MAQAQVIKLIWRLDYLVSFAYLDNRGTALRAAVETVENYWGSAGEGQVRNSIAFERRAPGHFRTMSLEPNSLNGSLEWAGGIPLERVVRDDAFRGADKVVKELVKVCGIKSLTRAGLRLNCLSKFADGKRGRQRTLEKIDAGLRTTVTKLGDINDVGITFEGKGADGVRYRATFGPLERKNITQVLRRRPTEDELKVTEEYDLFFDLDLYETRFSFAEYSLFRWAETKVSKAVAFVAAVSGDPKQEAGER